MKVKETIAFVGEETEQADIVINKLVEAGYPLVLVRKPGDSLSARIQEKLPSSDIETIDCEREACWEADVVLLANMLSPDTALLKKIRTVTTQKILICMAVQKEENASLENEIDNLRQELPYTQVVGVLYEGNQVINFVGKNNEAVDTVKDILTAAGLTLNKLFYNTD